MKRIFIISGSAKATSIAAHYTTDTFLGRTCAIWNVGSSFSTYWYGWPVWAQCTREWNNHGGTYNAWNDHCFWRIYY